MAYYLLFSLKSVSAYATDALLRQSWAWKKWFYSWLCWCWRISMPLSRCTDFSCTIWRTDLQTQQIPRTWIAHGQGSSTGCSTCRIPFWQFWIPLKQPLTQTGGSRIHPQHLAGPAQFSKMARFRLSLVDLRPAASRYQSRSLLQHRQFSATFLCSRR